MMKTVFFVLFCCVITFGYAEEVHIQCPKPQTLIFNLYGEKGRWNRYQAVGYASIASHNAPSFAMTTFVDSRQPVQKMWGASYAEQNTFICNYASSRNQTFPLVYPHDLKQEYPKDCHFKNGAPWECDGDEAACELVCQR